MGSDPLIPKTLDPDQVFIKTAKGPEEIRTRATQLPAKLRRLLIMVDGFSTIGQLMARLAALDDDLETHFAALIADGYLAPRDASPGMASKIAPATEFNLVKAKGFARFVILGAMGPAGARRAAAIEAVKTTEELRVSLDELREALPHLLPKRQAKHVWDQLEPLMVSIGSETPPNG